MPNKPELRSTADVRTAYSYIRFSTPEQKKGTSFQRQFENSMAYIRERGLNLDTSLNLYDEGRSAFTGDNREKGALSLFLEAIEKGQVARGSILIVENLDRLSREEITKAVSLFLSILQAGIEIVTLGDNRQIYTEESINGNFGQLIYSLSSFARGHEESAIKSQRLSAAWKIKRTNRTKKMTARAPAWLKLTADRLTFEVISERAALINRIFNLAADGVGHHRIAKILNEESTPTWGRGKFWQSSYIMKLLTNRSVLGEFQPHQKPKGGKRIHVGECIEDYFPPIIAPELFQKVHGGQKARRNKGGRVGKQISNLFTHLAKCGYCEAPMQFVDKGEGCTYLVCSSAKSGAGCRYMSWPYAHFEEHFLKFVEELDYSQLTNKISISSLHEKRALLEVAEAKIAELALKQKRLLDLMEKGTLENVGTVAERLRSLQLEEQKAHSECLDLKDQHQEALEHQRELELNSSALVELVKLEMNADTRQRLMTEIRRKVSRIEVCACGGLDKKTANLIGFSDQDFVKWLSVQRRNEEEWFFTVFFINGEHRTVAPMKNGFKVFGSSIPPSMRKDVSEWFPDEEP
jgi:DNA invertase Pin-like site-specific DNA recombinase